jgi:hypothetical protein
MRDYALGTTFDIKFTSRRFTTGAPFTLAGTPVISAYPDNSTTELTAGITLTVDFDARTGLNNIRVVATSGNGYAAGSNYALVITTGTIDSVSQVGEVVGEFSLEAQSPLRPATAGRTLVIDAAGLADATAVKVGPTGAGTAQTAGDIIGGTNGIQARLPAALTANGNMKSSLMEILTTALTETVGLLAGGFKKFFNVAAPTGTLLSIPDALPGAIGGLLTAPTTANVGTADVVRLGGVVQSLTDLKDFADDGYDPATNKVQGVVLVDTLTTYTGNTPQTGDGFARLGVPAGASVSADIAVIEAQTDDIGVAGAGLTSLGDARVANLDATISSRATPAQVNAEVVDGLSVDTYAEPTGVPGATVSVQEKVGRVYQALRNALVVDSNTSKLQFKNDGGTIIWEKDLTDAGGVYEETEGNAP